MAAFFQQQPDLIAGLLGLQRPFEGFLARLACQADRPPRHGHPAVQISRRFIQRAHFLHGRRLRLGIMRRLHTACNVQQPRLLWFSSAILS